MDENGLSQQELAVLHTFMDRKTVEQAAQDLGIPYSTCSRYVRELMKLGMLVEDGFRQGKKRFLITVKMPGTEYNVTAAHIVWNGRLQTIPEVLNTMSKSRAEVPVLHDVLAVLYWLRRRAIAKSEGNPVGGPEPADLSTILRRIQAKLRTYDTFIAKILEAPIWFDTAEIEQKLDLPVPSKTLEEYLKYFEIRYMADGKSALEG